MRSVRFDAYGDTNVLEVRDVDDPVSAAGRVVVRVLAASVNPGEIRIRTGALHHRWPATFPSGEGSDLSGIVEAVGPNVSDFTLGDEVFGWTDERASHAALVSVPSEQLVHKPRELSWEVAGSMFVAPAAAYASVTAVAPHAGETVVVAGAAGGVGSVAAQLAARTGARVIGLASEHNHPWLRAHAIDPIVYQGTHVEVESRLREAAPDGIDAFMDAYGDGYVDLAVRLGVGVDRIHTAIDFERAAAVGAQTLMSSDVVSRQLLRDLADHIVAGRLDIPIVARFPLDRVRAAYTLLAHRRTNGKIVLLPQV